MTISSKSLWSFIAAAVLSAAVWFIFTYPQLSFINLSVGRKQALEIAEGYMRERGFDPDTYQHATIFSSLDSVDQYLQKAIGFKREIQFFKEHDLELFHWYIRFFRENEKEQFGIAVSAATGEIVEYTRSIKDTDARPFLEREVSQQKAIEFLAERFGFNPNLYTVQANLAHKLDNRTDYNFSWEKNGVFVPWSKEPDTGGGRLLTSVTISGEEILSFRKIGLRIPEEYGRFMDRQQNTGRNLSLLFRILYFALLISAVFLVLVRRNSLVMHTVKWFCVSLTFTIFFLNLFSYFNDYEQILFDYPTTSPFADYFGRLTINLILSTFIVTIGILMPSLAGEAIHYEAFPQRKEGRFLHYLQSTFFSRPLSRAVGIGYLVAFIMIGIQSLAFKIGQEHLGVWIQYSWMTQLSSSYLPFITAIVVSFSASTIEEISFRIFSISLGKKFLKNTLLAVLCASVMWGYGHSGYPVFPMWFRGLEVTCLGLFLSFVYLRYGIIPVVVAHFLFDVFWQCSGFLFGKATPFDLYTSIIILLIPLLWALIAYVLNRSNEERPLRWRLNRHQLYNMEVLKNYLKDRKIALEDQENLKKEIVSHGWDQAVVEIVLDDLKKQPS